MVEFFDWFHCADRFQPTRPQGTFPFKCGEGWKRPWCGPVTGVISRMYSGTLPYDHLVNGHENLHVSTGRPFQRGRGKPHDWSEAGAHYLNRV